MWLARQLLCGENSSSFAGGAQCHLLEKELVWFSALELCSAPCQPQLHREVSEPFLPKAQETVPGTLWKPLGQEQNIQRQGLQWLSNEKQWEVSQPLCRHLAGWTPNKFSLRIPSKAVVTGWASTVQRTWVWTFLPPWHAAVRAADGHLDTKEDSAHCLMGNRTAWSS